MKGLIYNQRQIPRELHRYGLRSSAAVGCGWVAIHNALTLLGCRVDTDGLIRYLEGLLPLVHGNFGTAFWAPAVCLRRWGFPVELVFRRSRFDEAARVAEACILFYHWRRGAKLGAHFVALEHTDRGFVGYNTYRDSTGPDLYGPSLEDFLRRRGYFGPVLLAIGKRAQNFMRRGAPR